MHYMPRSLFSDHHEIFREHVRRFCEKEIAPYHDAWVAQHEVPRTAWLKAGAHGLLCCWLPETEGGPGGDLLCDFIVSEELGRIGATGPGFSVHSVIAAPYIARYGRPEMKRLLLPDMAAGRKIGAIVMTEPGAGSDVAGIRTHARWDGEHWVLNGQKTFITNGHHCDVMVVACKTQPELGARGITLLAVESSFEGVSKGAPLRKIGQQAQDTSELFFDNVKVPVSHVLGELGHGFKQMMRDLAQERLLISVQCQARAQAVFEQTVGYVRERKAFGQRIADFQNTRFKLAEMLAQLQAGRVYCDELMRSHTQGHLDAASAAAGKLWHSELLNRVADECLQLHGGYGYMQEFAAARAFVDARIERIYGGTSEIMKEVIARAVCDP
jgi:acyl-CoA dehydrogenase